MAGKDFAKCCGAGCALLISVGLVLAYKILIVWGVIEGHSLNIQENCPGNMTWEWLLTSLIVGTIIGGSGTRSAKDGAGGDSDSAGAKLGAACTGILGIGASAALLWWGTREMRDGCVEKHYAESIFYFACVMVLYVQLIIICLTGTGCVCGCFLTLLAAQRRMRAPVSDVQEAP